MTTPRLQWQAQDGKEQILPISSPEFLIGRNSSANLAIPNQHVSRQHAKLVSMPEGYQLVDLGSKYGTFVNKQRVDRRMLQHGDRITFGNDAVEFRFLIHDSDQAGTLAATRIVKQSFADLERSLPEAASDLEKILYVLDFQYQWSQLLTPETGLNQILESALKISGAERAFIMIRKDGGFGHSQGLDRQGRQLTALNFQTSKSIVREVVSSGKPVFMVEGIHKNFAAQESILSMNLRAVACLPLRGIPTDGDSPEILGILYLDSTEAMQKLSGLDQKILNKLATEAGNVLERVGMIKSIENRKTLERDLALAEETQRSLLPHALPNLDHLRLHAFCKPTRYVGGDFYDFQLRESGELIGVLADISGKGIAASVLSSMLLGCLQLLLRGGSAPQDALNRLNKFIYEKASGKFATMFLFSLEPDGHGQFISAGHNPAYVYRASSMNIEELSSNNMILGAFDFVSFEASLFEMRTGDILFVYSDGLTDAEDPAGEMFGEQRAKDLIERESPGGGEQLYKSILSAIQDFTRGRTQTDDITIIIAELV